MTIVLKNTGFIQTKVKQNLFLGEKGFDLGI